MSWKEFIEILVVFVLSALKFGLAGVPTAVFAKWSFFKVLTVTISGGVTGTVVFTHISQAIIRYFKKFTRHRHSAAGATRKKFTLRNKVIVRAKRRFGLWGIAILGPSLLSIPLGTFLAVRYFKDRRKIFSCFIISIISWAVLLYFFYNSLYKQLF